MREAARSPIAASRACSGAVTRTKFWAHEDWKSQLRFRPRDPNITPPVSEEEIKAHVLSYSKKGVISKFAVPQKILFVEALAKTSVGKFDKKALRGEYSEGA